MIAPASTPRRFLLIASLVALALTACGRRGPLEAPPDPVAIAAQKQRDEQRRQRLAGGRAASAQTEGASALQPRTAAPAQANRVEGQNPAPDEDGDDLPSMLPSAVPTAQSGRKRGFTIPKEPFILDPLL